MFTRRSFLKGAAALGAATASFNEDGMARALDAVRFVSGRGADDVAGDEDFWFEIQHAFTVDRTLINMNNGGVCPSPRVVQEAMRRYLEFSNNAPVYSMWRVLDPQIETGRRGSDHQPGLPANAHHVAATRAARRDCRQKNLNPGSAGQPGSDRRDL